MKKQDDAITIMRYGVRTTTIPYNIANDTSLSLGARGLYSALCTVDENWQYSIEALCMLSDEDSKNVLAYAKELKDCGYLIENENSVNLEIPSPDYY